MPDSTRHDTSDHDFSNRGSAPRSWQDAFAALPLEAAPEGSWNSISMRLPGAGRTARRRWILPLAVAATGLLAITSLWLLPPGDGTTMNTAMPVAGQPGTSPATSSALEALYAESAQLEALLAVARDSRVSTAAAAAVSAELEARVASIDAALMQPGLSQTQQTALWHQRVGALRAITGFESTRRWLAANGERYDGALLRVD